MFGTRVLNDRIARLERTVRAQEQVIRRLAEAVGVDVPHPSDEFGLAPPEQQLADAGQEIRAIKAYRERTGAGLIEARDAVRAYLDPSD